MAKDLETLIQEYVQRGIPRKMAKMLAQAKLKKQGATSEGGENPKERFKKLMKSK